MTENKITNGNITQRLLSFFFPIMIGSFFQQLYNTVDSVVVGNYVSSDALRAVGGTSQVVNLLVGFFIGLASGATVVISQYYGASDKNGIKKATHTAMALRIWGGLIMTIIGVAVSRFALTKINIRPEILDMSDSYLKIYFLGMIPSMIYNVGSGILRAVGDSKRPQNYLIITCIINIILDLAFVVGLQMGVVGVAVATIISQIISAALIMNALTKTSDIYKVNVKEIKFDKNNLSTIVKIGLPAGGQSVLYSMSNLVISSAVNSFGADTTRAWSAVGKIEAIIWMILTAFGTSVITFVGQNYGAGKKDRVRKSVKIGLVLTASAVAFFSALLYVFCPAFIKLFTQNTEVIDIGVSVLRIFAPFYALYSFTEVLSGAVKGSGEGLMPMIITVFTVCTMRLLWIWTVVPHFRTIQTVALSYPITWARSSFVLILYYMNYSKRKFH